MNTVLNKKKFSHRGCLLFYKVSLNSLFLRVTDAAVNFILPSLALTCDLFFVSFYVIKISLQFIVHLRSREFEAANRLKHSEESKPFPFKAYEVM